MKSDKNIEKKTLQDAYLEIIQDIDNEIIKLQTMLDERVKIECEPSCESIADGAKLRQLQRLRLKLSCRYMKL